MTPPEVVHEFTLQASELDAAGKHYVFPVRASWIRGVLEDDSTSVAQPRRGPHLHEATAAGTDGELDVRASKSGHDVVIHGTLKAQLTAPCARCLEPVVITVDHPVTVLVVPATRASTAKKDDEERELSEEEADTVPYDGETVILDDFVRDELMLETPMIPLCSEDCPGMRPPPSSTQQEAPERAIDPRLMPLLHFQSLQSKAKKKE